MNREELLAILKDVRDARLSPEEALKKLLHLPYANLKVARIDYYRELIAGIPEVIFAKDKSIQDTVRIARDMFKKYGRFLITRGSLEIYKKLKIKSARFYERSGAIVAGGSRTKKGDILILTAGTSDIGIAEEAMVTAEFLGSRVETLYDVGIAGLHRIVEHMDRLKRARVIIVIAGMEGALPGVVAALTDKPVIGVPTSSGYGMSLGGIAALLSMLNSCVPGLAVMNIDNGFGAACFAHRINILDKDSL
ncbi:MAG: nickel pincer cofactor biosynthesis protein LarB [Thermodesulfovibrionales bacterium]|nr:nickel pincer cofactor biosynthesis protein LarB [Thermodesulfovibrionales bacterium]